MATATGVFITLEGGEGAGKSTLMRGLFEALDSPTGRVVTTREPGGSPGAEAIRKLLLDGTLSQELDDHLAETLLIYAARADHLSRVIRPALARSCIVLCDRFHDSTHAYQGGGRGVPREALDALDRIVIRETLPDLTLLLDVDVDTGVRRAAERRRLMKSAVATKPLDRFEKLDLRFHATVREQYLERAAAEPGRLYVIDASAPPDIVFADAYQKVSSVLRARSTGREPA